MRALSPPALLVFCWGLTLGAAALALGQPDRFDLVPLFMQREALDPAAFTGAGLAWLGLALLTLLVGDLAGRTATRPGGFRPRGPDPGRAARLCFGANLGLLAVTALWIAVSAARVGGLSSLAALTMLDALSARDLLLENKLFTGMRLFYAALPATGCLAAVLLASGDHRMSRHHRTLCRITLGLNAIALLVLPVVMSQRLLLLQFLVSAYIGACLARGRLFGWRWIGAGLVLFLGVWVLREGLTNPHFDRSALDLGVQKLAFYFVNDLWNSFAPLQYEAPRSLGAQSLSGLTYLTFTDGIVERVLEDRLAALESVRGGGEFSLLVAPYVDFGPVGGAAFLLGCGLMFRWVFDRARASLVWTAVYAQIGAGLVYSSHGLYVTHQNFLFSLMVIAVLCAAASRPAIRRLPTGAGHAQA